MSWNSSVRQVAVLSVEIWKGKDMPEIFFPAEWYPQSAVQVTWPHVNTDWADDLEEVTACYVALSREILKREKLLVVCNDTGEVEKYFSRDEQKNLICAEIGSNDTWARDHGAIPYSLMINLRYPILGSMDGD
jgi:agmatine/peptidylarginine deiminase